MKKVVIHKAGGFEQLILEEHPSPQAGKYEIKIAVKAIGVNYADVVIRWGLYRSAKEFVGWPITPGFEVAGTVIEVGSDVGSFAPGQEVFAVTLFNGYSTEICIPQHQVFHKPAKLTMEEAAGFPAVFLTAYHAVHQNIIIRENMKVLIHSAAGGVGSSLVQLCKLKGCEIIAIVGGEHKIETAKNMGADHVLDRYTTNIWSETAKIFPQGSDVIFDANGGESLKKGFNALAKGGKIVVYGTHSILPDKSGRINWIKLIYSFLTAARFHSLKLNTRSIINFNLSFMFHEKELLAEAMKDLINWVEHDQIKPLKVSTFRLENVADAHKAIQSGKTVGKLILTNNE
ncbi:MAG: zinc-binding dehydrogenase [Chitinophagales bacterium]|nr:zinc-binding dehydrogenase [Chitinophagales bacterium]